MSSYKPFLSAVAALTLTGAAIVGSPILLVDLDRLEFEQTTTDQLTWDESKTSCAALGDNWELPSIYELFALYYLQNKNDSHLITLVSNTDYWSRNIYFGFAFGLNTHSGIASFDRQIDTDHFLCSRREPLANRS